MFFFPLAFGLLLLFVVAVCHATHPSGLGNAVTEPYGCTCHYAVCWQAGKAAFTKSPGTGSRFLQMIRGTVRPHRAGRRRQRRGRDRLPVPGNRASRRIAEKTDLTLENEVWKWNKQVCIYAISKEGHENPP